MLMHSHSPCVRNQRWTVSVPATWQTADGAGAVRPLIASLDDAELLFAR